jgi:hypothetical protein
MVAGDAEKEGVPSELNARLVRDFVYNPYRSIAFDRSVVTPTITSLAQAVYDDRRMPTGLFDNHRLGILADALEEAGWDNTDILGHLRNGGEHCRGCWVVDLVLEKK